MKIPDICKNSVLLLVILYNQLLIIALFCVIETQWRFETFGHYTIYCHWVALGCLFMLCNLRTRINRLPPLAALGVSFSVCIAVFIAVEAASSIILSTYFATSETVLFDSFRRFLGFLILLVLVFRLIGLQTVLERRSQAESFARLDALQSRINPHFLFNSLNTISELIASAPDHAEQAVISLAKLFRANLETSSAPHSLAQEIDLCKQYLSLERWRLGEKLVARWQIQITSTEKWQIPRLIVQPLVENAVTHGVNENGHVKLKVDIRETATHLSILIENSMGNTNNQDNRGNGIAVDNIKERLFVLYDDQQSFKTRQTAEYYQVIMQLPKHQKNHHSH